MIKRIPKNETKGKRKGADTPGGPRGPPKSGCDGAAAAEFQFVEKFWIFNLKFENKIKIGIIWRVSLQNNSLTGSRGPGVRRGDLVAAAGVSFRNFANFPPFFDFF